MQAKLRWGETETIKFNNSGGALSRNTVHVEGIVAGVLMEDVPAGADGALTVEGVFEVVKTDAATFTVGASVYWNATEDPFGGVAETGAATAVVEDALLGVAVEAATAETGTVLVKLQQSVVASA